MKEKWVAACSGGPDSMALLDWMAKEGLVCAAAHVNYHRRDSADRDEAVVRAYCARAGIPVFVLDAGESSGNFQDWARKVRYDFFVDVVKETGAKGVMTAHQQDDVLETWLMQRNRGSVPEQYGIAAETEWKGMKIRRPLLEKTKQELENVCQQRGIVYGVDESNLSDGYERNRVRHHVLPGLERDVLLSELAQANRELADRRAQADLCIARAEDGISLLEQDWFVLERWLHRKTGRHLGRGHVESLREQLRRPGLVQVGDFWVEHHLKKLLAAPVRHVDPVTVSSLEELKETVWDGFHFGLSGRTIEGFVPVFPLTIRAFQPGDVIRMRFGSKKVARFFADRKISRIARQNWPVVTDARGRVLFVPGLGCGAANFSSHPQIFMLK